MEAYVTVAGTEAGVMKPEFMNETPWNVFEKFLLTQVDCLSLLISWWIAISLAICRAILFFFVDLFRSDPAVSGSTDGNDPKPDNSDPNGPPKDDKMPHNKRPKVLATKQNEDSGFSMSSSSSGSPLASLPAAGVKASDSSLDQESPEVPSGEALIQKELSSSATTSTE